MKKYIGILGLGLAIISCGKSEAGNKGVVVSAGDVSADLAGNLKGETLANHSFQYRGLDGSRAKVDFSNDKTSKTVTIEANGKSFQLDRKTGGLYERNGIQAVAKGDSMMISQGGNEIPLILVK